MSQALRLNGCLISGLGHLVGFRSIMQALHCQPFANALTTL